MLFTLVAAIMAVAAKRFETWPPSLAPVLVALLAFYVGWIGWEGVISLRDARSIVPSSDRWTNEIYALAHGTTVLATVWWSSSPSSYIVIVAGVALFAAGLGLRVAAIRTLGAMYSHRARLEERHELITHGPYRWIRHPAYAGMLVIHVGMAAAFSSEVGAALVAAVLLPAIARRIAVEERLLQQLPGYAEYCRGTSRLIPGVW